MATTRMLLAGFGGQGVLLIGQMIAYSAMYEEKEVTWMPSYGPEMRGGTANCTVVVSDRPIASPLPSSYDVLLAMNKVSLEKYIDQLVPGGDLFINSSIIDTKVERDDINVHYVDTIGLAESKIGNEKTANMVMLLSMLNSCANGIGVVNIDNGYGAAYLASVINRKIAENTLQR